jgi:cardiolipin synthase
MDNELITTLSIILEFLLQLVFIVRALMRPHREPASRIAWIVVIAVLPVIGIVLYLFLGETNLGRKRIKRRMRIKNLLPGIDDFLDPGAANIPDRYRQLFQIGKSVNGFDPIDGNRGSLMEDSNAAIDSIVADMSVAEEYIHVEFYIWLPDNNGLKIANALISAAERGVTCRVMADSLGSRSFIRSGYWKAMKAAGVQVVNTLPFGNALFGPLFGRIDLRNHRKIVVIDNRITYCGSQNCADPEFLIKAKFAPWVDLMIRFEGPIVIQNQFLFIDDWLSEIDDDLRPLLKVPIPQLQDGFPAQVIGTGPTIRNSAMPELFETLMYAARRELVISTPYYVPDESMQRALCASARRGVETSIIFPAKIDSWFTAAACHSHYAELLEAGVIIYEYVGGLLHTKSLTIDGEVTLIGSANMDRRSFDLNYENNILFYDRSLTSEVRRRQGDYLGKSNTVSAEMVAQWPWLRRLWNNIFAMLGPVL